MSEWHDAVDDPPDEGVLVWLSYGTNGFVVAAYLHDGIWKHKQEGGTVVFTMVHAWTPLVPPTAPTLVKEWREENPACVHVARDAIADPLGAPEAFNLVANAVAEAYGDDGFLPLTVRYGAAEAAARAVVAWRAAS